MFYHQTRTTPGDTLAVNLPRALATGWRVLIRSPDPATLAALDAELWVKGGEDGFIPHARAGGPQDADQPVLLGQGAATNGARVLALLDGAGTTDAEVSTMERVWILFDGNDAARIQAARLQWKALTAAGHAAQYWSEADGRWEKKADTQGG